jgi:hypothetical protein
MTVSTESVPGVSAESAPAVSAGSGPAIGSLSVLVPGSFTDDDPRQGLEATLQLFEYGERLGFDGSWIRQQHLVPNVSSAVFLAATRRKYEQIVSDVAAPIAPRLGWSPSEADSMADAGRADLPVRDAPIERAELR